MANSDQSLAVARKWPDYTKPSLQTLIGLQLVTCCGSSESSVALEFIIVHSGAVLNEANGFDLLRACARMLSSPRIVRQPRIGSIAQTICLELPCALNAERQISREDNKSLYPNSSGISNRHNIYPDFEFTSALAQSSDEAGTKYRIIMEYKNRQTGSYAHGEQNQYQGLEGSLNELM